MLPKKLSTGIRYLSAGHYNTPITITQPNAGQAADGTPLPETTVTQTMANVVPYRGKELDKTQNREGIMSYKITIRYPHTYPLDTGMNILVRNQRHNIESFSDDDGQRIQMTIWTWVDNDSVSNS